MVTYDRKRLMAVDGLNLREAIEEMDEEERKELYGSLSSFIDILPVKEKEVREHFVKNAHPYFTQIMIEIREMLKAIRADDMSNSCFHILNQIGKTPNTEIKVELDEFFESLSTLLKDIKTARIDIEDTAGEAEETEGEGEEEEQEEREVGVVKDSEALPNEEECKKSVMMVDDVKLMVRVLEDIIRDAGFLFNGFNAAHMALRHLSNHKPDLIILDINMPDMDGYELAKKIREKGQTAPILFLTGNTTRESVKKAIRVGASEFLVKPINKEDVLEKIRKYI